MALITPFQRTAELPQSAPSFNNARNILSRDWNYIFIVISVRLFRVLFQRAADKTRIHKALSLSQNRPVRLPSPIPKVPYYHVLPTVVPRPSWTGSGLTERRWTMWRACCTSYPTIHCSSSRSKMTSSGVLFTLPATAALPETAQESWSVGRSASKQVGNIFLTVSQNFAMMIVVTMLALVCDSEWWSALASLRYGHVDQSRIKVVNVPNVVIPYLRVFFTEKGNNISRSIVQIPLPRCIAVIFARLCK